MGTIHFVSLGPGDPDLITVKALRVLNEANDIFCPETVGADGKAYSRAAEIVERLKEHLASDEPKYGPSTGSTAMIHRFPLPMSKDRKRAVRAYDAVCQFARALARSGRRVCMACEGDAGFYSSIHYIYDRLRDGGVQVELVSGIPAFIAAGTLAGLHLADGDGRLTVIPGTAAADEIAALAAEGHTLVIMKPSRCAGELRRCMAAHTDLRYHYFEQVGMPGEVYINERERIMAAPFPYFSLLIIQPS